MCGIAGFLDEQTRMSADEMRQIVTRMAKSLRHRGPDDFGQWVDPPAGIALGHQRLAIVDLSASGHQPMATPNQGSWIVFNGEIYNHLELRADLISSGHEFRGRSDTEVLLTAIQAWGLEETLHRSVGMFAFAWWDVGNQRLTLVRDRLGIKPLYYGWSGSVFLFGSELKALRTFPSFAASIDRNSLALLLQHCYIPTPYSIYQGIYKLPPGCLLTIRCGKQQERPTPVNWWSLREAVAQGRDQPFRGSREDANEELQRRLDEAIRLRMLADVPVGAFLSGGIDSSLVVGAMQAASSRPVRTFSIGFDSPEFNEAPYAKRVAEHLGTEHSEHYVSAEEALDVIPLLPTIFDEPFADSSQIPTYLLSKMTRQHVTVSLSGDGGDELFGGYQRYPHIARAWKKIGWLPRPLRQSAAALLGVVRPARGRLLRRVLCVKNAQHLYTLLNTHWKETSQVVLGSSAVSSAFDEHTDWNLRPNFYEQMMHLDGATYLPDDILTKVDRASMAVSLEARVPLLDHRLVEFAWSLPLAWKVRNGIGKQPLRDVLARYVPPALTERPKVGFGVPLAQWLRGELRDWAEALLDEQRLDREGFFQPSLIREKWDAHLAGQDWHYHLWDILMFQAWFDYPSRGFRDC
ncbi:MAG TPA: asparagine synthase (glutamine-hydrolyzing) [Pirellulaceae bacterium]|nr:asparagine synthase (glutamine-hydrolyzing) [Pirellulaceae bacterium]